jgi:hypothetical protein
MIVVDASAVLEALRRRGCASLERRLAAPPSLAPDRKAVAAAPICEQQIGQMRV